MRKLLLVMLCACANDPETKKPEAPKVEEKIVEAPKEVPAKHPEPRNFVCERFAQMNVKAQCTPELTDVGADHTHRAVVNLNGTILSCVINDKTLSVLCGDLIVVQQPQAPVQDSKKDTKKSRK